MEDLKRCKKCSNWVPNNSIFCPMCGVRMVQLDDEIKVPEPVKTANGWTSRITVDKVRYRVTTATKKEYYAKARAIKTEMLKAKEEARTQEPNLEDIVKKYIDKCKKMGLSPSTIYGYEKISRNRFKSEMKKQPSRIEWKTAIRAEEKNVSVKTVRNALSFINLALKDGGYPVCTESAGKREKAEHAYLTGDQVHKFLEQIKGDRVELGCLLGLHSLRLSEILDLRRSDIKDGTIHVQGAAVLTDAGLIHKDDNKTTESRRDIPIMIPRLAELVEAIPASDDYLIPYSGAVMYKRIRQICEANGLPNIGNHGLRHSFASLCYELEIPIKVTMKLGGWSTPDTVTEIYTHISDSQQMKAADKLKDFFMSTNPKKIPSPTDSTE